MALGKDQIEVIKCLKSLPADTSWNNVKAIWGQKFPLVLTLTHNATQLMHRYQQKGESLKEFNFEFSEFIQAVMNDDPQDITDPLKIMFMHINYLNQQLVSKLSGMQAQLCKTSLTMCKN